MTAAKEAEMSSAVPPASSTGAVCAAWARDLSALGDGVLSPGAAAALAAHLSSCASCRARKDLLDLGAAALRASQLERARTIDLDGFTDRVVRAVQADRTRPSLPERARVV